MSKKRDPLVAVIQYFNTVDLASAAQTLTVVREIVRSRQPRLASDAAKKKTAPAKPKAAAGAAEPIPPLN